LTNIHHYWNKHIEEFITDLQNLIRQSSISSNNTVISKCAYLVANLMRKAGLDSEVLFLNKRIPPVVFGQIKSKINLNEKTILFYNHYDTQPLGPIKLWEYHPLEGVIEDGRIYGRGSSDDKGELIVRIKGVECYLKTWKDVSCNIKFIVEGE
jgi:acetylornithine deacetylase/succinyl-diaminopimelate desuccinylase-like protein